jgi:hypothetical protein
MYELAQGTSSWLAPRLVGHPPEFDALLPYWLGAWAMQLAPGWMAPDFAARVPFAALLALTLVSTWYGVYHLARSPRALPVAFAFGGEASPVDYARAMADAALLALIACLGLAQFSHETTPSLAQLAFTALTFYGVAALPYRRVHPALALAIGLAGLALSGAATLAMLFGLGALLVAVLAHPEDAQLRGTKWRWAALIAVIALSVAALATSLDAWRWRVGDLGSIEWRRVGRMLLWFTWPAWPLALWTVWRWRRQLTSRHVLLPLWIVAVTLATGLLTPTPDRSLLLSLPALATLAAFALPTFKRSVASLIDWFTLLFFSGAALVIWVVWISLQTGFPAKPAANVAKLAPGFEPSFAWIPFVAALAGTAAWAWLVSWRTGRHREAIWKSLVLPAGGAALCWLLMMTLWLPVLDYARSYLPVVQAVTRKIEPRGCVQVLGLNRGQLAAFRYHARLELQPAGAEASCGWLLLPQDLQASMPIALDARQWQLVASVRRPADAKDNVLLYRRVP